MNPAWSWLKEDNPKGRFWHSAEICLKPSTSERMTLRQCVKENIPASSEMHTDGC